MKAGLTIGNVAFAASTDVEYLVRVETADLIASPQYLSRVTSAIAELALGKSGV